MDTHPSLPQDLWEQTPPEVRAYIVTLEARVTALESMVQALQDPVRLLEERLNQTSRNSSRPPSSDPPSSPRSKRPRSKRRRGGQPGHRGQTRTLIPVEDVDQIVPLKPEQCHGCQAPLSGDDRAPFRHQVIEMPPIQPVVTEYQWHQSSLQGRKGDGVPGLWRDDASVLASRRSKRDLRPPRPRHGGAV
jgi:transposase